MQTPSATAAAVTRGSYDPAQTRQLLLESARVNDEDRMHLEAGVQVSLARCD